MRLPFFLLSLLIMLTIDAQSSIEFLETDHDFGEIEEKNGFAEHTFHFVNNGANPIKITNVKASCGCTTPGWTKEEVMPGDSGFVKARYNPRNRPGRFRKSLRITASDPASNQTLYIMGFVKPRPKTPTEEYPIVVGDFRIKYQTLNIGKITTEKPVWKSFDIYNDSDSTSTLDSINLSFPEHIAVELSPKVLKAGEIGKLKLTYDPIKKNDYGFVSDNVSLDPNSQKSISVMAVIEEFFPEMTAEELDNAPKLEISNRKFDFGKTKAGTVIETSFELENSGKEHLEFRTIKTNCDCLTYEIKNRRIKKGKSQTLKVSFDTAGMRSNQYKSLTIYSNDPVNPTQQITIKGSVEK